MSPRALLVQRIFGGVMILAGVGKFAPVDLAGDGGVGVQLGLAADANVGTWIGPVTRWLADHETFSIWLSALAFISSGLVMVLNRSRLVIPAAVGQILMITCFMFIFHRAFQWILFVDPPFIAMSIYIAVNQRKVQSI